MAKAKKSTPRTRVAALRHLMNEVGVAAYLVPSTDPHQSEYLPACWERRAWLSGFSGSAGDVVVTAKTAGLWTDGRYYLQGQRELRGSGIKLFKAAEPATPSKAEWLATQLQAGEALGVDPRLLSAGGLAEYERCLHEVGAKLKFLERNLIDAIWDDRPSFPGEPIRVLPRRFTGETTKAKLGRVRKGMKAVGAQAHVLTTLDSIAWLFNIRGSDIDYNPVVIAYAIVTDGAASLFVDLGKLSPAVRKQLGAGVEVYDYGSFGKALRTLATDKPTVLVDPATCNLWVKRRLRGARLVEKPSPVPALKARKNATELEGIRAAHERDGVAMVRFLRWIDESVPEGGVTELSAANQLAEFRATGDNFVGLSFRTISGYGEHGAVIHYSVTPESSLPLRAEGLYLVDSGGQYLDGTTDITRTVLLGKQATAHQRGCFTRVLKGHIRLARAVFPKGVNGLRLDTLARDALWQGGLDYGHGTGHGVGAFLCVHEGPQSISPRATSTAPLELGNVLSNEPGYYEEGAFGIRIENLVVVREAKVKGAKPFYGFDTITLCPIDNRLLDVDLLDSGERDWLNNYHREVYRRLHKHLGAADKRWLKQATQAV